MIHHESELWAPRQVKLPEDWVTFTTRQQQAMIGSLSRYYVLGVTYNAQEVQKTLHQWGLQWPVVMAGWLWECDLEAIHCATLESNEKVIELIQAAHKYVQYIEDDDLPALFIPPYPELDALLIALAIYKAALKSILHLLPEEDRAYEQHGKVKRIRDMLLNITKRFGMWREKRDIEDLCFAVLEPEQFATDKAEYERIQREDTEHLEMLCLEFASYCEQLTCRPIYALYSWCGVAGLHRRSQEAHTTVTTRKVRLTGFDLVTFDILVPSVRFCYEAQGLFKLLGHIQGRVSDYIAHPKSNGYSYIAFGLKFDPQHLYLQKDYLLDNDDQPLVCQIEIGTPVMHAIMNYGCLYQLCYNLYKQLSPDDSVLHFSPHKYMESDCGRAFYAIQRSIIKEQALWTETRGDKDEQRRKPIIVYDQYQQPHRVPRWATAQDFVAYIKYPERVRGSVEVVVNNRKAPISRHLDMGDVVEVIIAQRIGESYARQEYVTTSEARQSLNEQQDMEFVILDLILNHIVNKYHHHLLRHELIDELHQVVALYRLNSLESYLGHLNEAPKKEEKSTLEACYTIPWAALQVVQQLTDRAYEVQEKYRWVPVETLATRKHFFPQQSCEQCQPMYPAKIIGIVDEEEKKIMIHRQDCGYLNDEARPYLARTPLEWRMLQFFRVTLLVEAQDRRGLVSDITAQLRYYQCLLQVVYAEAYESDTHAEVRLLIETPDIHEVISVRTTLLQLEGVRNVIWEEGTTPSSIYKQLERFANAVEMANDKSVDEIQPVLERRSFLLDNKFDISHPAPENMFFGHHAELKELRRLLCNEERGGAALIYGPRRSGKSSLGRVFLERNVRPPMWSVYFSLQGEQWENAEHFWRNLADRTRHAFQQQLHFPAPTWDDYTDADPQIRFLALLERCLEMRPDSRLVLILDEFGDALHAFQRGVLSTSFFAFWRTLMQQTRRISLMTILPTNSYNILRTQTLASIFDFAFPIEMQFLDSENARHLLIDTLRQQQIVVDHDAAAHAYMITAGNPYFLQIIGMHLVSFLNSNHFEQHVRMEHMQAIVDNLICSPSYNHFEFYRDELQGRDEITVLRAIMEITHSNDRERVSLDELEQYLVQSATTLKPLLDRMVSGSLLTVYNTSPRNPYYGYKIELVRLWMTNHQDFF